MSGNLFAQTSLSGAPTDELAEPLTARESLVRVLDSVDASFMASCGFVSNTATHARLAPVSTAPFLPHTPPRTPSSFGLRVDVPRSISSSSDYRSFGEGRAADEEEEVNEEISTGTDSDSWGFQPSSLTDLSETNDAASDDDSLCSPHYAAPGSQSPLSVLSPARETPPSSKGRATRRALWPEVGDSDASPKYAGSRNPAVPADSDAGAGPSTWQEGSQWQLPDDLQFEETVSPPASPPRAVSATIPISPRNVAPSSIGQHSAQAAQSFPHGGASPPPFCFAGAGGFPVFWPFPGAFPVHYPPIGLCAQDSSANARGPRGASGTPGEALGACKRGQAQKPAGVIIPPLGFWGHPQAPAVTLPPGVQLPLRLQVQLQLQQMSEGSQQRQHLPVAVQAPVANCPRAFLPPRYLAPKDTTGTGVFIPSNRAGF
ncbi:hypothetical protein CLOP_g11680 [Closterium sp. NIES-67]|nr:hypothetical protein CLOP_g11680 [Closterium sp. NIES-67]